MTRWLILITLVFSAILAVADPTVDCNAGQSLNRRLAKMDKNKPATITVKGTCTEYVVIDGFTGLTLNGAPGAALQQPSTNPENIPAVLWIHASQSVTVSGFAIHGEGVLVKNSVDIYLSNLTTDGSGGFSIADAGLVTLSQVTVDVTSVWTGIGVYMNTDVGIENSLIVNPTGSGWHAGLWVSGGNVHIQGTTIRDVQTSIFVGQGGEVDTFVFDPSAVSTDVVIENPAGTNNNGVCVTDGASFNATYAKLRITNAGQSWGGNTGAVLVDYGSTVDATSLIVSGSKGQGVMVADNSHVNLGGGASITGSGHGGLVVANLSTATVNGNPATVISGNGTDLFCDSKSDILGSSNISGATVVNCNNLFPWSYENLP